MIFFKLLNIVFWVILVPVSGFSQWIGFHGGPDGTDIIVRDPGKHDLYTPVAGYHIGQGFELRIKRGFTVETGLNFNSGGALLSTGKTGDYALYDVNARIRNYYVEVPVIIRYYVPFNKQQALFVQGGITGSKGIGGKVTYDEDHNGNFQSETAPVEWGENPDTDDFKPFTVSAVAGIGTQYKRFQFTIGYARGISDISPYAEREIKMFTNSLFFTFHYKFTWLRRLIMPFYEDINDVYPWTRL